MLAAADSRVMFTAGKADHIGRRESRDGPLGTCLRDAGARVQRVCLLHVLRNGLDASTETSSVNDETQLRAASGGRRGAELSPLRGW